MQGTTVMARMRTIVDPGVGIGLGRVWRVGGLGWMRGKDCFVG